uniref:Uncharacterized protein n=1 Tax=Opuntia streptacantha TaxID=393608 RepID=A0A7C9A6A4_OPUST
MCGNAQVEQWEKLKVALPCSELEMPFSQCTSMHGNKARPEREQEEPLQHQSPSHISSKQLVGLSVLNVRYGPQIMHRLCINIIFGEASYTMMVIHSYLTKQKYKCHRKEDSNPSCD